MTMLYPKLERSFNAEELHQMLSLTLTDPFGKREESHGGFRRIERPPMPPGSSVFEQAKGELEIERQSEKNGKVTLPSPCPGDRPQSGRRRLNVPLPSPVPPAWGGHLSPVSPRRGGNLSRHNSAGRRSPSPFSLAPHPGQSGRHSPFLQVPSTSRPTSARSNRSGSGSRSGSPK